MKYKSFIKNTSDIICNSPIRDLMNSEKEMPADLLKKDFTIIESDSLTLIEKIEKPLKLVILGEVKAGKSTFINALASGDVSPVEVTETTASIIKIYYRKEERGIINKKNNDNIEGTIEEIYQILENNKNDIDFFSNVKSVELGYPLTNLKKLHIVDTPGLASITEENEKTTVNFVQSSDVILWVFNGNHLGQSDVGNKLSKIAKLGKPIIGIVNRIDEVDSSPERLKMYMKKNYGEYLKEVFTLSAYNAYKGQLENKEKLINGSGYYEILDYLENNIEKKSDEVHKKSMISSAKSLLEQDLALHESYSRNLLFIQQQIQKHKEEIEYNNKRIKNKFENSLKSWTKNELLKKEEKELLKKIEELGFTSSKKDKKKIENRMKQYLSNENIKEQLTKKLKELSEEFEEEWESAISEVHKKMKKDIKEFIDKEDNFLSRRIEIHNNTDTSKLVDVGKGAAIAGSAGLAWAAYGAWLGPYAAYYSIGATVGAIIPPLLIGGAVVGLVGGLVKGKKNKNDKKEMKNEIRNIIKEIRREKMLGEIVPKILEKIKEQSDEIAKNVNEKFINGIAENWKEEELNNLNNKIDNYCTRVKMLKNKEIEINE